MTSRRIRIQELRLWRIKIPYSRDYISSLGLLREGSGIIVQLTTDNGVQGFGEASFIFPDRSGETAETAWRTILELYTPRVLGRDPYNITAILCDLGRLSGDEFSFPYSIAAIDIALHDLRARLLEMPLATSFGGSVRSSLEIGRSLSIAPLEESVERARELAHSGYKMLTLKGGPDWRQDIRRFLAVRKALGEEIKLELDPNQAYPVKAAIRVARALENAGLDNLEQPCSWWDLEGLARVTKASSVTVSADEAVMCPADVMRVTRMQAADSITIKLARVGGFQQATRMLHIAQAAGLGCNLGSKHTFGIGTAALLHYASAHPYVTEPLGYASPLGVFRDDIIRERFEFSNGRVNLPEGPGLGVSLNEDKLLKYSQTAPETRTV